MFRLFTISNYDFTVLSYLALISALVHSTSLLVLDEYFKSHRSGLRRWRLALITILTLFLIAFEVVRGYHDLSTPCTPILCSMTDLKSKISHGPLITMTLNIMVVLFTYIQSARALNKTFDNLVESWMYTKLEQGQDNGHTKSEMYLQLIVASGRHPSVIRTAILHPLTFYEPTARMICLFWATLRWLFQSYKVIMKSICLYIMIVAFYLIWSVGGIFGVFFSNLHIVQVPIEIGIGQIVPICLLLTILFVWREASAGKQFSKREYHLIRHH